MQGLHPAPRSAVVLWSQMQLILDAVVPPSLLSPPDGVCPEGRGQGGGETWEESEDEEEEEVLPSHLGS
eukprot:2601747-Pyramimonas_sp.AAC.1